MGDDQRDDQGDDTEATTAGPRIDLRGALHVAGHEVELLHAEDVADTAPVIGAPHDDGDFGLDTAASYQLRGMDADLFRPGDDDHR